MESILIRQAVVDTVSRLCRAFDERDRKAGRCVSPTDELNTDYSRLALRHTTARFTTRFDAFAMVGMRAGARSTKASTISMRCEGKPGEIAGATSLFTVGPSRPMMSGFFKNYGYYRWLTVICRELWLIESITQFAMHSDGSPELHGAHRSAPNTPPNKLGPVDSALLASDLKITIFERLGLSVRNDI